MNTELINKVAAVAALLNRVNRDYAPAVLASSLSIEDMVLTDLLVRYAPSIEMFTLDTGRLPAETYALIAKIKEHYGRNVRVYFPETTAVENYVNRNGVNAFYRSVELREQCCAIRKVEPLKRALAGKRAWVTGMRREQSLTRTAIAEVEYDHVNGLDKFNPLANWSEEEVWRYIRTYNVSYNELYDKGYVSIGCAPCTRAITKGEDIRAGRWWWEQGETKECGIHRRPTATTSSSEVVGTAENLPRRHQDTKDRFT